MSEQNRAGGLPLPERPQEQSSEATYLMDAGNGMTVRVPANKAESFQQAQASGQLSPGLLKYGQQIKERILNDIYGEQK